MTIIKEGKPDALPGYRGVCSHCATIFETAKIEGKITYVQVINEEGQNMGIVAVVPCPICATLVQCKDVLMSPEVVYA